MGLRFGFGFGFGLGLRFGFGLGLGLWSAADVGHEGLQPAEQRRHRLAARGGDGEHALVARRLGEGAQELGLPLPHGGHVQFVEDDHLVRVVRVRVRVRLRLRLSLGVGVGLA